MPRTKRRKSITGIYHVILRGINRQQIFEEQADYEHFLILLKSFRKICGYEIYAYCLMPNHVHLLIKEGTESLGQTFRRIGTSFVYWYNLKYERVGHLFQDRFKSEPVENISYLLTVIRYIHWNPVKAGICRVPEAYRYSSFAGYDKDPLIETGFIYSFIDKNEFLRYQSLACPDADSCLDVDAQVKRRLTDEEAKQIMALKFACSSIADYQNAEKSIRIKIICALRAAGGSVRQISRLTGASIGTIRKYS